MSDRPVPETGPQAADSGLHERRSQDAATDLGVPQGDGPATWEIRQGDALERLREMDAATVQTCITSPPYWGLRDYGDAGQLGLEPTPDLYVQNLVKVFREVRRVLRDDGTVWLNLGDSHAGSGPSGASYESATTKRRREQGAQDGAFRVSPTLGDRGLSYAEKKPVPPPGLKPKDLVGIPWRVAFALQQDGWWLRSDIVWNKPNPMPESVTDRPTKSHEYLFLLAKSARYFYDADALREPHDPAGIDHFKRYGRNPVGSTECICLSEPDGVNDTCPQHGEDALCACGHPRSDHAQAPTIRRWDWCERCSCVDWAPAPVSKNRVRRDSNGDTASGMGYPERGRNKRSVWTVATQPYPGAHFATFPPKLIEPCVLAGSAPDGLVLDPFCGAGTTGLVALRYDRSFVGIELNPDYCELARQRIRDDAPLFNVASEAA